MIEAIPGNLTIRPMFAKLTRDVETFGTMDTYCVIQVGSQKNRTRVSNGGKNPNWDEVFVIRKTIEDIIQVAVWDYHSISHDQLVGEGSVSLARVLSIPNWEDWVEIYHHGRKAGDVKLNVNFLPDGGQMPMYPAQNRGPNVVVIDINKGGPQGYPPQPGYPQPGFPPQGFPQPGFPPQAYPPQGYPQPGFPPQAYPPQGYPPQGYPPQGYPPQGYPPQGYPPQGYPPQGYPRY